MENLTMNGNENPAITINGVDQVATMKELEDRITILESELYSESNLEVGFVKLADNAVIPVKGNSKDTGMDVWTTSTETVLIRPCSKHIFKTGLAPISPEGWGLNVKDRSNMGSKGITYTAGVIDNPYHGEIGIILANINSDKLVIISDQDKEEVEKAEWFDVATKQFITDDSVPCEDDVLNYKVLNKSVLVIKYLKDAIAQLMMVRVPTVEIVEMTMEDLEKAMEKSERKANGYGSTNK